MAAVALAFLAEPTRGSGRGFPKLSGIKQDSLAEIIFALGEEEEKGLKEAKSKQKPRAEIKIPDRVAFGDHG